VLRQIDSCSCSGVRHTDNAPVNILFSVVRHYRTELLNLDQGPALSRFFRDNVRSSWIAIGEVQPVTARWRAG
jgi:hypothetical protein